MKSFATAISASLKLSNEGANETLNRVSDFKELRNEESESTMKEIRERWTIRISKILQK